MASLAALSPVPLEDNQRVPAVIGDHHPQVGQLVHPDRITELVEIKYAVDALTPQQRWEMAAASRRAAAEKRRRLLRPILALTAQGVKDRAAILNTIARIEARDLAPDILDIAKELAQKNAVCPGRSTFYNWLQAYRRFDIAGLLPQHTGRVRQAKGWEIACLRLFHIPSKPGFADVSHALKRVGLQATAKQVGDFIKSLPAEYGVDSPWRVGVHYFRQNLARYVSMDHSSLEVGQMYQGDGHTCDAYIEHPHSGHVWRAELTIWIDVRSHYIPGHYLSAAESGETTLYALSVALQNENHVPDKVHIDNGSGFVNQMMSDRATGFYNRFGIDTRKAIAGNSKGKGLVEGWFRTFRNRHDKFWNGGKDYCGHDQAAETNRQITQQIKQGKRSLLSYELYKASVAAFIHEYNHTPQRALGGLTPAQVWAGLKRNPVELQAAAIVRPQYSRSVSRSAVTIFNRQYEHETLRSYHKKTLFVEVDLNDESAVWIYDQKQRLVCRAELKTKKAFAADSISEDRRLKREAERVKRVEKRLSLIRAEESRSLDHADSLSALYEIEAEISEALTHSPQPRADFIQTPSADTPEHIEIDILSDDY
ncbi:MAG: Mu transposase C-terminal domain-containing protein [Pseudomonadales bacterium]